MTVLTVAVRLSMATPTRPSVMVTRYVGNPKMSNVEGLVPWNYRETAQENYKRAAMALLWNSGQDPTKFERLVYVGRVGRSNHYRAIFN